MLTCGDGSPTKQFTFSTNTTLNPTLGREKRVRGCREEWEDDSIVVWSEVTGLCVFWDGSCRHGVCSAGMLINIFKRTLG